MLLENLWTETGLVNGALGTIRDLSWDVPVNGSNVDCRQTTPKAILVDFDKYTGPGFINDHESGRPLVPVFRSTREWTKGSVQLSRTQFPLTVSYAITIHKSQGITVDKAVMNIADKKDFTPGLTYVAISRVKSLYGLLFEESFDLKRLRTASSETTIMRAADHDRRAAQEIALPDEELPTPQLTPPPIIITSHTHSSQWIPTSGAFQSY